jgi:S-formylglutathione hydrolase
MAHSRVVLSELISACVPHAVPYAVVMPAAHEGHDEAGRGLPLLIALHGGGGSRESLVQTRPLLEHCWDAGVLPPMAVAMASAEMSYYLDHPDGTHRWETLIAGDFLQHLRRTYGVGTDRASTAIMGWSMGGYGALKMALRRPEQFCAVAAIQPLLDPTSSAAEVGARNRLHHMTGGPRELIGEQRDHALIDANNPANIARDHARAIRETALAIYIEAGDHDVLNVHDGAEYLHRVLWELDVSHEYHLVRGADHVGPTVPVRTREALVWLGHALAHRGVDKESELGPEERAWFDWLERGCAGEAPPPVDSRSAAFARILRAQLRPVRERAADADPTALRRYGVLPPTAVRVTRSDRDG